MVEMPKCPISQDPTPFDTCQSPDNLAFSLAYVLVACEWFGPARERVGAPPDAPVASLHLVGGTFRDESEITHIGQIKT